MKKVVTIIEIKGTQLKVFQAIKDQMGILITHRQVVQIAKNDVSGHAAHLKCIAAALPCRSDEYILLVSRHNAILRPMAVPSNDYEEIQDIIGLQLIRSIPYRVESIIHRHYSVHRDDKGINHVRVIIMSKKLCQDYHQVLKQAGINNARITLSSFGIQQWLSHQESIHETDRSTPTAIINIDASDSEICFCYNKELYFSRSLPFGINDIRSGNTKDLIDQIKITLRSYQNQALGPKIERIFILSPWKEAKALSEGLMESMDLSVKVFDPLQGLPGLESREKSRSLFRQTCSFTAAIGAVLFESGSCVDLTPAEIKMEKQERNSRDRLLKYLTILLAGVILHVVVQTLGIHRSENILHSVKEEIALLEVRTKEARNKLKLVQLLDQKNERSYPIVDVIAKLGDLAPDGISLQRLSMDQKGQLTAQGHAKDNARINEFQENLVRSPQFQNVDLKYSAVRKGIKDSAIDFMIAAQIEWKEKSALGVQ